MLWNHLWTSREAAFARLPEVKQRAVHRFFVIWLLYYNQKTQRRFR